MKRISLILITLLAAISVSAAPKKQNLKVLYVGGSSNYQLIGFDSKPDSAAIAASVAERSASFTKMLKQYFKTVACVNADDYTEEMSKNYDVTVFDARPHADRKPQYIFDGNGEITGIEYPKYLDEDYDCATLSIAEVSDDFAHSLGLKTDWYCLCLYSEAHHWNAEHEIFKGPFPVELETYMGNTPEAAKEVAMMFGHELPEKTEMFRINDEKWFDNTLQFSRRVGLVCRPDGFGDPDDEVISSGVCTKSIDAVAIGRHGNFFHWGFAASPDYLTPQAKNLLANCIVYISKFKGEKPIARKVDERLDTRHWLGSKRFLLSTDGYEAMNESNRTFYGFVDSCRVSGREKIARGETPTEMESLYLSWPDDYAKLPTYNEYLRQREPLLYKYFGENTQLYLDYYKYNEPYFYCGGERLTLVIDEECRELHLANNDINTLDKCISILEDGTDKKQMQMASTILERYTNCRFNSADSWRNWFETYKEKLFFSEGGMFKWYVNEQGAIGNELYIEAVAETQEPIAGETSKNEPIFVAAEQQGDELVLKVKIHQGYHIYALVSDKDPFIETEIGIELPAGISKSGDLKKPQFKPLDANGTMVYEGDCIFRQPIAGNGKGIAKITIGYQCCDETTCFPPVEKILEVEIAR